MGKKLKNKGFALYVITEAFKREGHNVQYKFYPWKRAYDITKKGEFHATGSWGYKSDREKDFIYGDAVYDAIEVFYHLKSVSIPDWNQLSDLKAYKFGATRGYTYTTEFWDLS